MTIHFDTLDYANTLEGAGIERKHAQALAQVQGKALQDLVANELVTKDYLRGELAEHRLLLEGKILASQTKLDSRINTLESKIDSRFAELEFSLRDEIRREGDALRLQMRSLQYGGALAAFVVSAAVMFSRLIK